MFESMHQKLEGYTIWMKYLAVVMIFGAIISGYYFFMRDVVLSEARESLVSSQQAKIDVFTQKLQTRVQEVRAIVSLLESSDYIQAYLQSSAPEHKLAIQQSWVSFSQYIKYGKSIRLMDKEGWEIIRVDYDYETNQVEIPAQYQFQGASEYFQKAINQEDAGMFLDEGLHEELGIYSIPYIWAWNFVLPVPNNDTPTHVLVFTVYADNFLSSVIDGIQGMESLELVNSDGYFVYGANQEKLFGHVLEDRRDKNLELQNYDLWYELNQQAKGVFTGVDAIYIYDQMSAWVDGIGLREAHVMITITNENIQAYARSRMYQLERGCWIMVFISLIVSFPIAWWWAKYARLWDTQMLSDAAFRSTSPILITDNNDVILDANPSFLNEFGFSASELRGFTPNILRSGKHPPEFFHQIKESLEKHHHWDGEVINRRKDGKLVTEFLHIDAVVIGKSKTPNYYVANYRDISELKKLESRLRKLTITDSMTGIFNRRHFEFELQRSWDAFVRYPDNYFTLAILDIDFFKKVNDVHGHDVGDQVIKRFSRIIAGSLRNVDFLARIGGEEFAVILPKTKIDGAKILLERVRQSVASDKTTPVITCSIGLAESSSSAEESLFKCADRALYDAKESGRNRVCVYNAIV